MEDKFFEEVLLHGALNENLKIQKRIFTDPKAIEGILFILAKRQEELEKAIEKLNEEEKENV